MIRSNIRLLCGVGTIAVLLGPQAFAVEIRLAPISASGPHRITGNQITLDGSGQTVVLEIRVDKWATVSGAGSCDDRSACHPGQACSDGSVCRDSNGQLQTYQARISGASFRGVLVPVRMETKDLIDTTREDFLFAGRQPLTAVDTSTLYWGYGGLVTKPEEAAAYDGRDRYLGTFVLEVPEGATGSFTVGFVDTRDETLAMDTNALQIYPLDLVPVTISLACSSDGECDDRNPCTVDTCTDGACSNRFDRSLCPQMPERPPTAGNTPPAGGTGNDGQAGNPVNPPEQPADEDTAMDPASLPNQPPNEEEPSEPGNPPEQPSNENQGDYEQPPGNTPPPPPDRCGSAAGLILIGPLGLMILSLARDGRRKARHTMV